MRWGIVTPLFLLNGSLCAATASLTDFSIKKRYRFEYRVEILSRESKSITTPPSFKLWVPFPREDRYQKVMKYKIETSLEWKITKEEKFGNRMVYLQGHRGDKPIELKMSYIIERSVHRGFPGQGDRLQLKNFLLPSEMIPMSSMITQIANTEAGSEKDPAKIISRFYNYIYNTMRYDKSGDGWGRGDAIWACDSKRGNCTDFHSLFIGMARSKKIPARFEMGVSIHQSMKKGVIPGYHCWAEAYDEKHGWRSIDASEAKKRGKPNSYFGKLPSDRIHLSRGRDIVLSPRQSGAPLNYFIYPYLEEAGVAIKGTKKTFYYEIL